MSLFNFRWVRRFFRQNMTPIPEAKAAVMKRRLSLLYVLVSWNAFGVVCYLIYNGKGDWAAYHGYKSEEELKLSPGQQWAKVLNYKQANIYKVSGFNLEPIPNPLSEEQNETDDNTKNKL